MKNNSIDLSIAIVNWNTRDLLAKCLSSLYDTINDLSFDVWVVDNASSDASVEMVRETFPAVHIIENTENVGFARANNQAINFSQGRYVLLFNSDAIATPFSVQSLVGLAESKPEAGVIGARLLNPDGSFQASHTPFPTLWQEFFILSGLGRLLNGPWYPSRGPDENNGPQLVDSIEGACMLVRRKALEKVGGLDEGYFMYAEEVDWCYAMKGAGWQVWYQPAARVIHVGGGSSNNRQCRREADLYSSRVRFFRKHYGDRSALLLKLQIYCVTALKIAYHKLMRKRSRGRYGRPVVSLRQLSMELKKV
jgi:GT2 family glycosyltransferase